MRLTSRSALSRNPPPPVMLAVCAGFAPGAAGAAGAAGFCCANVETTMNAAGTTASVSPSCIRHRNNGFILRLLIGRARPTGPALRNTAGPAGPACGLEFEQAPGVLAEDVPLRLFTEERQPRHFAGRVEIP